MTKIVFLDVDGVLNSTRSCVALGGYGFFPRRGRMEGVVDFVKEAKLDPIAVLLLNRLVKESDAHVVISSTWRMGSTIEEFNSLFAAYVPDNVIKVVGMTPVFSKGVRGDEIQDWINGNLQSVDKFVILDDDSDMLPHQLPSFVQTDHACGLSHENFMQAKFILTGDSQ